MENTTRVKTFKVDLGEGHGVRKGQTLEIDGHPRATVTRTKGSTVWLIPVPEEPKPEPKVTVEKVLTWAERAFAIYRIVRMGRI